MKLEDTGQSKSFAELLTPYLFAFQRYWKLAFGPALVVAVLAMLLARKLPDYFMADAVIFIQPPRITSDIVDNPGREEMRSRLEAIVQDILSRPRLRRIINQYKLYPEIKGAGSSISPGLSEIQATLEQSVKTIRSLTWQLSPPVLYDFDLDVALGQPLFVSLEVDDAVASHLHFQPL